MINFAELDSSFSETILHCILRKPRVVLLTAETLFGKSGALAFEIGPGTGEFLCAMAQSCPSRLFLGAEIIVLTFEPNSNPDNPPIEPLGDGEAPHSFRNSTHRQGGLHPMRWKYFVGGTFKAAIYLPSPLTSWQSIST